jgi:hypothetical protein
MSELRYRIEARRDGELVNREQTNSLRVVNEVSRAMLDEGLHVIIYDEGKRYDLSNDPTGLGGEADSILDDFFSLDAASRRDEPNFWSETPSDPEHPGYRP